MMKITFDADSPYTVEALMCLNEVINESADYYNLSAVHSLLCYARDAIDCAVYDSTDLRMLDSMKSITDEIIEILDKKKAKVLR